MRLNYHTREYLNNDHLITPRMKAAYPVNRYSRTPRYIGRWYAPSAGTASHQWRAMLSSRNASTDLRHRVVRQLQQRWRKKLGERRTRTNRYNAVQRRVASGAFDQVVYKRPRKTFRGRVGSFG